MRNTLKHTVLKLFSQITYKMAGYKLSTDTSLTGEGATSTWFRIREGDSFYQAPDQLQDLEFAIQNLKEHMQNFRWHDHAASAIAFGDVRDAWFTTAIELADRVEMTGRDVYTELQDPRLRDAWGRNRSKLDKNMASLGAQLRSMLSIATNNSVTLQMGTSTAFGEGLMANSPDDVVTYLFENHGIQPMDAYYKAIDDKMNDLRYGYDSNTETPLTTPVRE